MPRSAAAEVILPECPLERLLDHFAFDVFARLSERRRTGMPRPLYHVATRDLLPSLAIRSP